MRGASLGSGAEEIQHNDKQKLCQDEVEQPKLFAQCGAVGLDCGLSRAQFDGVSGGQFFRPPIFGLRV